MNGSADVAARNADLVLEGGGVKGIALVGVLTVLEERGYTVRRVAGTSAGAIVGALAAAGMPAPRMREVMRELDYRRFKDARGLARIPGIGQLGALLLTSGLYGGDYARSWLREQLADHGVVTFSDLRGGDPGAAVAPGRDHRLVVMASDVTQGALRRLPWDYAASYGCDPDEVEVVDAVRASMSIPYFFRPVRLADRRTGRRSWLVDGGMLSNFPVGCFDRSDAAPPRWPTFGVKLSERPDDTAPAFRVRGPLSLTRAMVGTMAGFYDRLHIAEEEVIHRTIFVDTSGFSSIDFDLDRGAQEELFERGRRAAERFIDGGRGREPWDFGTYLRRFRTPAPQVAAGTS